MRRKDKNARGFTLIELLLAMFIFSMVMSGLAVIYSTAFTQSFKMIRSSRLKMSAQLAAKSLQTEIGSATYLETPAYDASSSHLHGYRNLAFDQDGKVSESGNGADPRLTALQPAKWFHFCVSANVTGACGDSQVQPACLWYYQGTIASPSIGSIPGPTIDDGTCGSAAGGVTPELISSWITNAAGLSNYFTRRPADNVGEKNQVRVGMMLMRPATSSEPLPTRVKMDTTFNAQFSNLQ